MPPRRPLTYLARILVAPAPLLMLALPAMAAAPDEAGGTGQPSVAYRTEFRGPITEDASLLDLVRRSSELLSLQDDRPATTLALVRRANRDADRLREVLRSEGFYDGSITYQVNQETKPYIVAVDIDPNAVYLVSDFDIVFADEPAPKVATDPEVYGLPIGSYAKAADIVAAQDRLFRALRHNGRPYARLIDRKVVVDHASKTVAVTLGVNAGPPARFGAATVRGLRRVSPGFVLQRIPWKRGETYDQDKADALRNDLNGTGLFRSVAVQHADTPAGNGEVPMTVVLIEADQHSVGAGVTYSTSEGPGVKAFWEDRNLLGHGESLRLTGLTTTIKQSISVAARRPRFLSDNQDLFGKSEVFNVNSDAYNEVGASASVGLERRFPPHWRGSGAVSLERSHITQPDGSSTVALIGLPLAASRDTTKALLDPVQGTRFGVSLTPYAGINDTPVQFVVAEVNESGYLSLDQEHRFVLAGRARIGSIVGEPTDRIPASKRFYAGGGGSIRGYRYQLVGPLDAARQPIGGRSLIEVGSELRIRIGKDYGIVPFIDGGNVYDTTLPQFDQTIRWAAGLGFRYYTSFGPLRLDIALPLDRRHGVDHSFEFYVSLGQAF